MEKSVFLFSLMVLFSLYHCFTISKCNQQPSPVPLISTTTTTTRPTTMITTTTRPSLSGTPSNDILASVVNASLMDFNETTDGYFDLVEHNTSDTSIDDDEHLLRFAHRWEHLRERKKQQRLYVIQNRIKDLLGVPRKPNVTSSHISDMERRRMAHLFEILQNHQQATEPDDVSAERVQSFYPSCTVPRNTDRELWEDPGAFHVYYDVPSPRTASLTVSSAKLRLFKSTALDLTTMTVCEDDIYTTNDRSTTVRDIDDQHAERLRISIFQYVRPLRRSRRLKKKKLVDSRMVSANYNGWLDFDVGSSSRDWLENSSKNLGLEIVVEDALANAQNPLYYLHNMNCTEDKDHPFPHFTEEMTTTPSDQIVESSLLNKASQTYPTLDLRTIEVVEAEIASAINKNELNRRRRRQTIDDINLSMSEGDESGDNDCDADSIVRSECCAIDLDVSFKELGFDGIVAPETFRTKVCLGNCTSIRDDNEPNESDESNDKGTCLESQTEPLVVLHYDEEGELVIRTITDIVRKSCGCGTDKSERK